MPLKGLYKYIETKKCVLNVGWGQFVFIIHKEGPITVDNNEVFGYTDFDKMEIHLSVGKTDEEIPESIRRLTVLHEIFHVIADMIGLSAEIERRGLLPAMSNEDYVERTSKGLLMVQALNPDIFNQIFNYE